MSEAETDPSLDDGPRSSPDSEQPPPGEAESGEVPALFVLSARAKVVGALVALALVVVAFAATRGGDSAGTDTSAEKDGTVADGTTSPGAIDMFDRGDGALGISTSGDRWSVQNGTWQVRGGKAAVTTKPVDRRTTATVDTGSADGSVDVVMDVVRPQCGVVFRMRGPIEYLALLAVPNLGTWNLIRVGPSGAVSIGNLGQAQVADGTHVRVELSGSNVIVSAGNARREFVVPELSGATKAGLVCGGPQEQAAQARFSQFVYLAGLSVNSGEGAGGPGRAAASVVDPSANGS